MNLHAKLLLIIVACLIAAGCGSPGEPLPPSLELPRPVTDLRAARKGNQVTLSWSIPTLTTEGRTLNQDGSFSICRALAPIQKCDTPIAQIPFKKIARENSSSQTQTYVGVLAAPSLNDANANFYYAISALNSYRRTAGLSNQVQVPAAPALPAPEDVLAQVNADGVQLTWRAPVNVPEYQGMKFIYRVHRREAGANAGVIAGEVPVGDSSPSLVDHSFEWEKTYDYWVSVVTVISTPSGEQHVEGDDSGHVQAVAHDVFPPAAPTGLQAVFSGPDQKIFIDLIWTPNTEEDLAGYNVYRHEQGMPAVKIDILPVKTPVFRDGNVLACVTYFYSVSAVDVRGNESPRSEEVKQGSSCELR